MRRSPSSDSFSRSCSGVRGSVLRGMAGRPITLIVPWGAGGAADQLSRALAPLLEKDLKVPVNVVLRPGGSGAVGHTHRAGGARRLHLGSRDGRDHHDALAEARTDPAEGLHRRGDHQCRRGRTDRAHQSPYKSARS